MHGRDDILGGTKYLNIDRSINHALLLLLQWRLAIPLVQFTRKLSISHSYQSHDLTAPLVGRQADRLASSRFSPSNRYGLENVSVSALNYLI